MSLRAKIANELNSPEMLKFLGQMMLALGIAVIALRPLIFAGTPYLWGGDYNTFWAASWLAQHDGLTQLYGTKMLENIPTLTAPAPPWFYPPPMLLLVYPAAWLPFIYSYAVFVGLSLLAAIAIWKCWKLERLYLLLLLAAPVTLLNILYGQNGLITGALWIGGLLLLPKKPFIAGCVLGLLVIKPQLIVLAPLLLLVSRNWSALAGFVFSATLLMNISWFTFGPEVWLHFVSNASGVTALMQTGSVIDVTKIGSLYMAARMAGDSHIEALIGHSLFALLAIIICCHLWSKRDVAFGLKAAAALVTVLLITPYQFIYDLTLLLGAIVFWYQTTGHKWRGLDRFCVWLLWLSPLLAQGMASTIGIGCLPAILMLALWQIAASQDTGTKPA